MRIALLALTLFAVACGQNNKPATRAGGKANGKFSVACTNPVDVKTLKGETEVPGGMTGLSGKWELEGVASHTEITGGKVPGTITMRLKGQNGEIICHNSRVTPQESNSVSAYLGLPFSIDADAKTILAEVVMTGEVVNGAETKNVKITKVTKPLPTYDAANTDGNQAVFVKTSDGKAVLRTIHKTQQGQTTMTVSLEAVFKAKK